MGSADGFPVRIKRLEDVPASFREALCNCLGKNEDVVDLMFSPAFRAAKFSISPSVLCVTGNRWLVVMLQDNGSTTVDTASYEATLLFEFTLILLYGQLKIDFVSNSQVRSIALYFNTDGRLTPDCEKGRMMGLAFATAW